MSADADSGNITVGDRVMRNRRYTSRVPAADGPHTDLYGCYGGISASESWLCVHVRDLCWSKGVPILL